jgi:hypothetical protein
MNSAESSDSGTVDPPPCKQPVEIRKQKDEWVIREYYREEARPSDGGTAYGACDTRIEALRIGKETMESHRHPCVLQWESSNSVGGLYWNPLFECLAVRFSELLRSWVVAPKDEYYVFETGNSTEETYQLANSVLEQYDFKMIQFFSRDGELQTERKHRFLRNNITKPGVKFG